MAIVTRGSGCSVPVGLEGLIEGYNNSLEQACIFRRRPFSRGAEFSRAAKRRADDVRTAQVVEGFRQGSGE